VTEIPDNHAEEQAEQELEPSEAIRDELRRAARHPRVEAERLHDVADEGEAGSTPFIEISRVVAFLLPVFLIMLGLAYGAYRLIG
jgi:hypothetical protein